MKLRMPLAAGVGVLAALAALTPRELAAGTAPAPAASTKPFTVATAVFEQNATDGDYEVVFEVMGGAEGLAKLTVVAPGGRTVVDLTGSEGTALGLRQFRFETPEPKNAASLKAVYPEGKYEFSGTTASGAKLHSSAALSHALPAPSKFVSPAPDAEGVATKGLVLKWTPVAGVDAYMVYLEQEELNVNVNARLPGSATSFTVPEGFLAPGREYVMGVGTVSSAGNSSYVEASFKTAAK